MFISSSGGGGRGFLRVPPHDASLGPPIIYGMYGQMVGQGRRDVNRVPGARIAYQECRPQTERDSFKRQPHGNSPGSDFTGT